jgi:hypothetical protein
MMTLPELFAPRRIEELAALMSLYEVSPGINVERWTLPELSAPRRIEELAALMSLYEVSPGINVER